MGPMVEGGGQGERRVRPRRQVGVDGGVLVGARIGCCGGCGGGEGAAPRCPMVDGVVMEQLQEGRQLQTMGSVCVN
jgi:hypothetical protein